jgi:hypothetical protein
MKPAQVIIRSRKSISQAESEPETQQEQSSDQFSSKPVPSLTVSHEPVPEIVLATPPLTPQSLLHEQLILPDAILSLLGPGIVCTLTNLPQDVLDAVSRDTMTRRRLFQLVRNRLNITQEELRTLIPYLPENREILAGAVIRFALAAALSAHRGVLEKPLIHAWLDTFGKEPLAFALSLSPVLRREGWKPSLPMDAAELKDHAIPAFLAAIHGASPALCTLFAACLKQEPDESLKMAMDSKPARHAAFTALHQALSPAISGEDTSQQASTMQDTGEDSSGALQGDPDDAEDRDA